MYPLKTKSKYDSANLAATGNTFTTVYLGNYESGNYDEDVGSHPGVDIVPMTTHDTVVSVLDGIVHFAGTNASNGNYAVVKHEGAIHPDDASKKTTLFSVYLHLHELSVTTGQRLSEGDAVGKCGSTGQSTGEHLHFQIDRTEAPFHPYWPFSFAEAQEAGLGFFEAVNRGLGLEKARKYTVNPLTYLDSVSKMPKTAPASNVVIEKPVAPERVAVAAEVVKPAAPVVETPTIVAPPVELPSSSNSFSDVPSKHFYATAIAFVKDRGIASGSNGKFRPEDAVTRSELLKMAFNASGKPLSQDLSSHFSDVPADSWYLPYVNTARELKAVGGYSDGTFRPNNAVTRAEALKICLGILSIVPDGVSFKPFTDVETSAWYCPYAAWAKSMDVLSGSSKFNPDAKASRAEIAWIIYAAMTS